MKTYIVLFTLLLNMGILGVSGVISADQNLSETTFYVA
jgi:hypothetical protein